METFSMLLALCEGDPPVTFDVFFDAHLNKTVEHAIEMLMIWEAMALIMMSQLCSFRCHHINSRLDIDLIKC